MVDRYTKVVLTIIAGALIGILLRPLYEPVPATGAVADCGTAQNPCFVTTADQHPLAVRMTRPDRPDAERRRGQAQEPRADGEDAPSKKGRGGSSRP